MTASDLMPLLGPCRVPALGIGTYDLHGEACTEAVREALKMGYRLVDTGASYQNEDRVGEGIRQSGVPREELFVVIKIAVAAMGSDEDVRSSLLRSIESLGIGYADCAIIHWPGCGGLDVSDAQGQAAARTRCWKIMQALQAEHKVRFMGVSNFLVWHFAQLPMLPAQPTSHADSTAASQPAPVSFEHPFPVMNQIELHPLCAQHDIAQYCRERGISLQQYSPLAQGKPELLQHPTLLALQAQHFSAYTVPDMLIMWGMAQGYSSVVRSSSAARLRQNLDAGLAFFSTSTVPLGSRPPLTDEQRDILVHLRTHLGLTSETPDQHVCWYSSKVM